MEVLAPWRVDFGAMKELFAFRAGVRGQRAEAITGFLRPLAAVNKRPAKTNYGNDTDFLPGKTSTFRSQLRISASLPVATTSSEEPFFE